SLAIGTVNTITNPAAGSYAANTFSVATSNDVPGNPAAAVVITADTTPPDTSITAQPANPTTSTSASFSFTGTDDVTASGSLTFQCDLDGGGFGACTSPKSYAGPLAAGSHTFQVKATDQAGNTDPTPASYAWTIDLT